LNDILGVPFVPQVALADCYRDATNPDIKLIKQIKVSSGFPFYRSRKFDVWNGFLMFGWMLKIRQLGLLLICVWLVASCNEEPEPAKEESFEDTLELKLYEHHVLPQTTDQSIVPSEEFHYAYVDNRVESKEKLVVFLSGTDSYPQHYQLFSQTAASLGYHVVNLNYPNGVGVIKCFDDADENCFQKFHEEVIFGNPVSDFVEVDSTNSIYGRTLKLLQYLTQEFPEQGWGQFHESGILKYEKLVMSGHSQGGGHAAYFAYRFPIDRLIMFAAPNDYSEKYDRPASWFRSEFATSSERFFGLIHKRDEIVSSAYQYAIWKDMQLLAAYDTISADHGSFSNHHGLVTDYDPNPDANPRLKHNVPVRDNAMPPGSNGDQLKSVWKYLLGQ
jgi:hypothetical protein